MRLSSLCWGNGVSESSEDEVEEMLESSRDDIVDEEEGGDGFAGKVCVSDTLDSLRDEIEDDERLAVVIVGLVCESGVMKVLVLMSGSRSFVAVEGWMGKLSVEKEGLAVIRFLKGL